MYYGVTSPDWKPGQSMSPAGALLFRTRSEAQSFAPDAQAVAVAVRFDVRRGCVRPRGVTAQAKVGHWAVPAVGNSLGGVTVFGPIPAALVRPSVEVEAMVDWRPRVDDEAPGHPGFGGWDSLTMALLA